MSEANAAQAEFWNADPGRNWVIHQPAMDRLLVNVTDLLMAAADPRPGERVLDVGCCTGTTLLASAAAVGGAGRVLGVDLSGPMLALADARCRAAGLSRAEVLWADAQDHAFAAGSFDLVLSRFGMMFFADPVAALRNLGRALRPGGRMALLAWGSADENPFFRIPGRIAAARLGPVAPPDPAAPGPLAFADAARVLGLLRAAGLADVAARAVDVSLDEAAGVAPVLTLLGAVGGLPRIMREKGGSEADMRAILAEVGQAFAPHVSDAGLRLPAKVNLFTARRG